MKSIKVLLTGLFLSAVMCMSCTPVSASPGEAKVKPHAEVKNSVVFQMVALPVMEVAELPTVTVPFAVKAAMPGHSAAPGAMIIATKAVASGERLCPPDNANLKVSDSTGLAMVKSNYGNTWRKEDPGKCNLYQVMRTNI